MRLTYDRGYYRLEDPFDAARVLDGAKGFQFSKARGWFTRNPKIASQLRQFADETAKQTLDRSLLRIEPWRDAIPYPPHETTIPKPWQLLAAEFALSRNRSYLGLDRRLGKLITSVLISNAKPMRAVYVTRPFLIYDVVEKFKEWSTWTPKIELYSDFNAFALDADIIVIPDSKIADPSTWGQIRQWINDGEISAVPSIYGGTGVRLYVDEAHRYKNLSANRSRALFGRDEHGRKMPFRWLDLFTDVTFLSGTPAPNRPMELFPVLSECAPETIEGFSDIDYGRRYCAGRFDGRAWDFKGVSRLEELAEKIRPFMLRIKKEDVGYDSACEEIVCISQDLPAKVAKLDRELLRNWSPNDLLRDAIAPNAEIATYRKELGIAKLPYVIPYLESLIEDGERLLIFAYHRDVVAGLADALKAHRPFVVTGSTPPKKRHEYQRAFQKSPSPRPFLGNLQACGEGLNLFTGSLAVFVEWDWVPGNNAQAMDRMFHIKKGESAHARYLVFQNSMDRRVLETDLRKRKTTQYL